ncbi:MAG: TrkH family potassium uptake protein, partial [Muribaculaceae bacterium]|nr:TrkH family potassium uptake protein [Muribaculaceae bacterium]
MIKTNRSYINLPMLLRVVGWLLLIEAVVMIIPCITGIIYNEPTTVKFFLCAGFTAAFGMGMVGLRPKSREMGKREAILLTALTWIILSLFGMLPFLLCETHLNVTDAFFETMSGFTTTGASVLNTLEGVPHSVLIWRCLVQWIGGLGIILFTLAVLPMLNYQGGMQLFNAEVTGITHDKLRPRVSFTAQGLWMVYIGLTLLLILLLSFSELNFFDSICYGMSTMSTGGFAVTDESVVEVNSIYVKIVLIIFMFLGGVNFALIFKTLTGNFRSVIKNDVLKWYVVSILICYVILTINVWIHGLIREVDDFTIDPLFQAVSILTSTGLTEPDFHDWGPLAVVVLIIMMVVGACAGSTSGGAKIDRFIILFKFLKNEFFKMMHPNAVTTVCINGKGTPTPVLMKTLAFLFIYVIVVLVGGTLLVVMGLPLKDSFFVCLSAISNTGLGTDITGISGNFALVPEAGKWLLSFIMLIGRLDLFTVLLLFLPS